MVKLKTLMLAAMGLVMAGSTVATTASAETYFQATHPRRAEVNHRLAVQKHRIVAARREGLITPRKAAFLHRQDKMIRHEERADARLHGGHITKAEQRVLNHKEARVNRALVR
jgi:hypothetical protein